MYHYLTAVNTYVAAHKKMVISWAVAACVLTTLTVLYLLIVFTNPSRIVYQPVKACDLLTPAKAQDLLGDKVIGVDTKAPDIGDNVATSKCSYTDTNPDPSKMKIVAIAVRSGINDKGVAKNKSDYRDIKPTKNVEAVGGVGDDAYFNHDRGQLNVLKGGMWLILNYGVGAAPETNTVEDAVKLAHKVIG